MRCDAKITTRAGLAAVLLSTLTACASFSGRPADYQDRAAVIKADGPYLTADVRTNREADTRPYRDKVVYARLEVVDLNYYDFEGRLMASGSALGLGADLATLALNGLAATTGGAATKAALAAASAGVVGAKGAVNTDVFYQKTLPALVTQMRADRKTALIAITRGLRQPIADYPLQQALADINTYYVAGTLPGALSSVTSEAGLRLNLADAELARIRNDTWIAAATGSSAARMIAWLYPNGDETKPPNGANLQALTTWMNGYAADPLLARIPYYNLLHGSMLPNAEADRQQAIKDLTIPEVAQ